MAKGKLVLCVLGVQMSFIGHALALDSVIIPISPFQKPNLLIESVNEPVSCAQFSGHWQGACEGVDGKKDLLMNIEQHECSTISVDGVTYRIDGMETTASSQGIAMTNGSTVLSWEVDKTKILGNTHAVGQVIEKRRSTKFQYTNKFTMEREKQALVLTTESQAETFVNDFKKIAKGETTCRLEKVIDPKLGEAKPTETQLSEARLNDSKTK